MVAHRGVIFIFTFRVGIEVGYMIFKKDVSGRESIIRYA